MSKKKGEPRFPLGRFFLACAALIIMWASIISVAATASPCTSKVILLLSSPQSVAALFGGLAFVAMFFTVTLQSDQLNLQKRDIDDTSTALAKTAEANILSAEIARKNLRAQYLMHWINQNDEEYTNVSIQYHDITLSLYELSNEGIECEEDVHASHKLFFDIQYEIETYKFSPELNKNVTDYRVINRELDRNDVFELLRKREFVQQYLIYQKELDDLTAPISELNKPNAK